MKLNTKYILCFFIGIILYLLLNNINTFNIGIPPPPLPPGSSPGRPKGGGSSKSGSAAAAAAAGGAAGGAAYPIEYYCSRLGLDVVGEDKGEEKALEKDALEKVTTYINKNMSEISDELLKNKDSIEFRISDDEFRDYFNDGEDLNKHYTHYNIKNVDDIARFLCYIHNFLGQLGTTDISLEDIGGTLVEQYTIRDTIDNLSRFFSDAEAEGPGGGGETSEGKPFMSPEDWEHRGGGLEEQGPPKKQEILTKVKGGSVESLIGPSLEEEDPDL